MTSPKRELFLALFLLSLFFCHDELTLLVEWWWKSGLLLLVRQ